MLKGKEVISDPQRQYEIARELHHKSHGGINKTTASIAESYHWVRIKETVSQVIRNCPECSEMNKGLSAVRAQQTRYVTSESPGHMPTSTPGPHFPQQSSSLDRADSPSNQLQLEAAQHHDPFANYHSQHNNYQMPVDPALMDGMQPRTQSTSLEDLPPSPFLAAGQPVNQNSSAQDLPKMDLSTQDLPDMSQLSEDSNMSGAGERAATASMELRRRLTRAGFSRRQ